MSNLDLQMKQNPCAREWPWVVCRASDKRRIGRLNGAATSSVYRVVQEDFEVCRCVCSAIEEWDVLCQLIDITKHDGGACSPNGVFVIAKPLAKRTVTGG